jgi:hypothetical protein
MNDIEKGNKAPVSYDDIKTELEEKGHFVLEEGTQFVLELGYTPPEGEYILGESLVAQERRDIVSVPNLVLQEGTMVGDIVEYRRGDDGERNLYKFTLTNPQIIELEEKSIEYERDLISRFDVPGDLFETPYPEGLGDIDMSMYAYYHPHRVKRLQEEADKDPHWKELVSESKALNKEFVKKYLGEDADTEGLESVRIVTRI